MASEFKPGDKVAFLNSEGGGKVLSIPDDEHVLIELDEGFEVKVNRGEIVKERNFTTDSTKEAVTEVESEAPVAELSGTPGVYLAFDQSKSEEVLELYVINNTNHNLYFVLFEQKGENLFKGLSRGELEAQQYQMINRYNTSKFDEWPPLLIQGIYFANKLDHQPSPVHYVFKPKARSFFKAVKQAPVLDRSAHLFRVDEAIAAGLSSEEKVKSAQTGKYDTPQPQVSVDRPPQIIDLHIEKLIADYSNLDREMILAYQLQYFEQNLERAIAHDYEKMIFIHGVGNGVLRERMHLSLKRRNDIHSFIEADKRKYGHGATEVRLKKSS